MKDPTTPPTEDRKKIMFYDTSDRQSKLRIRCDYDGISQSQFFRMMITGYIENDELIYNFMKKCKEKYHIQGENKRDKIDRIRKFLFLNLFILYVKSKAIKLYKRNDFLTNTVWL